MTPERAQLLDSADTEEERGNYASAAKLRERAAALEQPWERLTVEPVPGEPHRFTVASQSGDEPHLCDAVEQQCDCYWGERYRREGVQRDCAHLKALRQWIAEQ